MSRVKVYLEEVNSYMKNFLSNISIYFWFIIVINSGKEQFCALSFATTL